MQGQSRGCSCMEKQQATGTGTGTSKHRLVVTEQATRPLQEAEKTVRPGRASHSAQDARKRKHPMPAAAITLANPCHAPQKPVLFRGEDPIAE